MDRAGSISFSSLAGAATRAVADRRGSSRTLGGDHVDGWMVRRNPGEEKPTVWMVAKKPWNPP